ncbi:MAG: DUF2384 domain-containing protein [Gammaproteobacteria bacterium]|jgi:transcriptional regulator with XRE-family HTH domain|nr:DUF2384 domain-containing protein [Gammaproteobacteria bacterium]
MMKAAAARKHSPSADEDRARVLARAVHGVADHLGLTNREISAILGISESSVTRLRQGRAMPYPGKEAEFAALLVRLYRSLDTLVGGDTRKATAWFRAPNAHLNGIPAERIRTIEGLVDVVQYLDAMRGKL